tara:strand:- start:4641 stop:6518 length:1878 start_codon:yes stop_codon:yes gene_type:complete
MALLIDNKFSPRSNPGDTNYPNGSIKNETTPGAKDGTPLDADWGNDYAGFDAALFAETSIVPDGNPDTALISQRLTALQLLHVGNLNKAYEFKTVGLMLGSVIPFPDEKIINITDNGLTTYIISTSATGNELASGLYAKANKVNNKYTCPSVQSLILLEDSNGGKIDFITGDLISTGVTDWRVVPSGNSGLVIGSLEAIPLNGAWLQDWGVDLTGVTAVDTELAAAISLNKTVMLSTGTIKVASKKVVGTNTRIHGLGPDCVIDAQMSDILFEYPRATGRSVKRSSGFSVISTGNTMTNGVVFLIPGTETSGVLKYTSGWKFENIEVGGGGEFGCIWDISDTFRFTARDCGYTSVTNPVRIRGSVVQCTIDNVTGNNTDQTRAYDGQNCGVFMQVRSDYSDLATRVPENVKVLNSGFVKHNVGIQSVGLAISSVNCDLDFIRDIGWNYGGGDSHTLRGGYIAHSGLNVPFIGIKVQKAQDMEAVTLDGVTLSTYFVVASKQTAVQIGDGNVAPFAEPTGVTCEDIRVVGAAGSWDFGVQADRTRSVEISRNKFKRDVIKSGGFAINASNSKNVTANGNKCRTQAMFIGVPLADGVAVVKGNDATLTTSLHASADVDIAQNRNSLN